MLYDVAAVAALAGVSLITVRRWVAVGAPHPSGVRVKLHGAYYGCRWKCTPEGWKHFLQCCAHPAGDVGPTPRQVSLQGKRDQEALARQLERGRRKPAKTAQEGRDAGEDRGNGCQFPPPESLITPAITGGNADESDGGAGSTTAGAAAAVPPGGA